MNKQAFLDGYLESAQYYHRARRPAKNVSQVAMAPMQRVQRQAGKPKPGAVAPNKQKKKTHGEVR